MKTELDDHGVFKCVHSETNQCQSFQKHTEKRGRRLFRRRDWKAIDAACRHLALLTGACMIATKAGR